jgi:hypothetical protein
MNLPSPRGGFRGFVRHSKPKTGEAVILKNEFGNGKSPSVVYFGSEEGPLA